jgi:hypothetical protein
LSIPDNPRMVTAESLIQFLQTFHCPGRRFSRVLPSLRNPIHNDLSTVFVRDTECFLVEVRVICFRVLFNQAGFFWSRVAVIWTVAAVREQGVCVFETLWRREEGAHSER